MPQLSMRYLRRAFLRSVRSPCWVKTRTIGCWLQRRLVGAKEDAAVGSELTMAGDAAKQDAKVDAGGNTAAFADFNSHEADVVGVGDDGDGTAVIEGDVELAWQFDTCRASWRCRTAALRQRGDVEQFVRVETGDWGGGDVANVVCAGAAGAHARATERD